MSQALAALNGPAHTLMFVTAAAIGVLGTRLAMQNGAVKLYNEVMDEEGVQKEESEAKEEPPVE